MRNLIEHYEILELHLAGFKRPEREAIIRLDKEKSKVFQVVASRVAKEMYPGFTRADLDMKFWAKD